MPTEDPSTEDLARRIAAILTAAMNLTAILDNAPILQATDPVELRSALSEIADEITWLASVIARGSIEGLASWPPDADARLERLRDALGAWNPANPPPPEVLEAARECLKMLQPT
jgi:hypothetical protein